MHAVQGSCEYSSTLNKHSLFVQTACSKNFAVAHNLVKCYDSKKVRKLVDILSNQVTK